MKDGSTLLTKGPIMRTMVVFALPIMLGNLFQQLYNTVDSLVVGNFVDSAALAAVVSTNHIISLTVGFLQGVFVGAGVAVAKYYGAGDEKRLGRVLHTTAAFALCAGLVLSAAGVSLSPWLLRLIRTPEEVFPLSCAYFRIYYSGILSVVLYNCATGMLQAVGDSRHPLIYLMISSLLNIVLDLIFVIRFGWGVKGAATATVISQSFSAILAFSRLMRSRTVYRIRIPQISFDGPMLREILSLGIPSGLQTSVIAIGNLVTQSHVNSFGAFALAATGTFLRIESFAIIAMLSLALATSTFISQNAGAGEYERAHKGARYAMITNAIMGQTVAIIVMLFAPQIMGAFSNEPEVIRYGVMQSRLFTPFYLLPTMTHSLVAVLRGIGRPAVPMGIILFSWCGVRVTYLTVVLSIWHDIRLLYLVYPLTWLISASALAFCYLRIDWNDPLRRSASGQRTAWSYIKNTHRKERLS